MFAEIPHFTVQSAHSAASSASSWPRSSQGNPPEYGAKSHPKQPNDTGATQRPTKLDSSAEYAKISKAGSIGTSQDNHARMEQHNGPTCGAEAPVPNAWVGDHRLRKVAFRLATTASRPPNCITSALRAQEPAKAQHRRAAYACAAS